MYDDLLGAKFKIHGRNRKEGFDCYGLAIEVLKRQGIEMKDVFYDNANFNDRTKIKNDMLEVIKAKRLEKACINCIVEIEVFGQPKHIGVYIGGGKMIHCTEKYGVVIEPLKRYANRIRGYYEIEKE